MNIHGGPEELATFIRCVNGEPTTWLDIEPEPDPEPVRRQVHSHAKTTTNLPGFVLWLAVIVGAVLALKGVS